MHQLPNRYTHCFGTKRVVSHREGFAKTSRKSLLSNFTGTMGSGKDITISQKGGIITGKNLGHSYAEIAKAVGCSKASVSRVLAAHQTGKITRAIPQDFYRELVRSMPRRIQACIANNGGHTKY